MFKNDGQRKAVMAMYSKINGEMDVIRSKNAEPIFPMDQYSRKGGRGSVPLLPSTFVIRGGTPSERKKIKSVLDMVGDDPAMESVNQIRILKEAETPIQFEDDKSIIVNEEFLKSGEFDVGVRMLAMAYRASHPEESEGREFVYAEEVVEPKIKEKMRIVAAERERKDVDVHQVGVDRQPEFEVEVSSDDGFGGFGGSFDRAEPPSPSGINVNIITPEDKDKEEVSDRSLMMGVSSVEDGVFDEQLKSNIYFNPPTNK